MSAVLARQDTLDALRVDNTPVPTPGTGDVLVRVRGAGYTPGELSWPSTWLDRSGHDREPAVPCHEFSGTVAALGWGAAGFAVGDAVYGLGDWYRDGAAAEYIAVEARNVAPSPRSSDWASLAALPLAGLTAWQALFDHGRLAPDESVWVLGAAGAVGALTVQLARRTAASLLATVRRSDERATGRQYASRLVDLSDAGADDVGGVDLIVDTVGGAALARARELAGSQARIVSIVDPSVMDGARGNAFFVVEPDRRTLEELAQRFESGELEPVVGVASPLHDAPHQIKAKEAGQVKGKLVITVASE
jgi:NADPH:quinone reductase-like Zn-dependent oxidoreductase